MTYAICRLDNKAEIEEMIEFYDTKEEAEKELEKLLKRKKKHEDYYIFEL